MTPTCCKTEEEKILSAHISDLAERCRDKYTACFTAFLDERQAHIAEETLRGEMFEHYCFYGGYKDASRKMLGVFPEFDDCDISQFPLKALVFRYRESDKLTHRDFLGAIMACRINRNMVGDIIVNDGYTVVFVSGNVSEMLLSELKKIGSVGVKISEDEDPEINSVQSFEEINGTVPSLRADCIVSLALKISREQASRLIKAGEFTLNFENILSVSKELETEDIFSVKGYGKFVLFSINGRTKKDRLHICVKKFL